MIDLAGDAVTLPDAAKALSIMLEWFDRVGYNADIPVLEREFGVTSTTLTAWAAKSSRS